MMRRTAYCLLFLLATTALVLAMPQGCAQSPFPPNAARTPYTRYQILRGEERPAKEASLTGRDSVNLRNRLKPLGDP